MQRTLVFTREERLLLIEAAALTPAVSATLARRLKGLLWQLEMTTGSAGCFPGQDLLGLKMGATKRTIGKWVEQLRRLKILTTSPRRTWAGRRQLDYHVEWAALRTFCTPEALALIEKKLGEEKLRIAPKNFASGCEASSSRDAKPVRRPYRNNSLNLPSGTKEVADLVQEVNACGVDQALPAVNASLAAGCTAAEIRAAIAHYKTLAEGGVKPGALYVKLMKMSPGEAANRRFPRADASVANRQHQARTAKFFQEQAESEADTAARDRAEREELELAHGPYLDSLSRQEVRALVEQTGSPGLLHEFCRKPTSALVRAEVLKLLSARSEVC